MRVQKSTSGLVFFVILAVFISIGIPWETAASNPLYECPKEPPKTTRHYDEEMYQGIYVDPNAHLTRNMSEFLATFRDRTYDDWFISYTTMKRHLYAWKSKHFADNLNPGDSIYESACGLGLNLLMTIEILAETKGVESIENIRLYGNDFLSESASSAQTFLDLALTKEVRRESICTGDSTNLSFVPANAFDLVYTGYLTPRNFKDQDSKLKHVKACEDPSNDEALELRNQMQRTDEDWYARWVAEMIRIAKPGKVVIIEHITPPLCDNSCTGNWGGVAREWWPRAIEEYSWDIDPQSLVMMNEMTWPDCDRYHLLMRRKPSEMDEL
jgi:ubiquinone/menaquinone biosynthesis C-methylase UbiE